MNWLRKWESGSNFPAFSLRRINYAPQNRENSRSLSHSLASIPLNPTGSQIERIDCHGRFELEYDDHALMVEHAGGGGCGCAG